MEFAIACGMIGAGIVILRRGGVFMRLLGVFMILVPTAFLGLLSIFFLFLDMLSANNTM